MTDQQTTPPWGTNEPSAPTPAATPDPGHWDPRLPARRPGARIDVLIACVVVAALLFGGWVLLARRNGFFIGFTDSPSVNGGGAAPCSTCGGPPSPSQQTDQCLIGAHSGSARLAIQGRVPAGVPGELVCVPWEGAEFAALSRTPNIQMDVIDDLPAGFSVVCRQNSRTSDNIATSVDVYAPADAASRTLAKTAC